MYHQNGGYVPPNGGYVPPNEVVWSFLKTFPCADRAHTLGFCRPMCVYKTLKYGSDRPTGRFSKMTNNIYLVVMYHQKRWTLKLFMGSSCFMRIFCFMRIHPRLEKKSGERSEPRKFLRFSLWKKHFFVGEKKNSLTKMRSTPPICGGQKFFALFWREKKIFSRGVFFAIRIIQFYPHKTVLWGGCVLWVSFERSTKWRNF